MILSYKTKNMANNHGLRTTGVHTGNFGKPKVQGKPGELDLTKEILNRDNLRIPRPEDGFTRLQEAYAMTTDPKLKAFLAETLAKRRATLQPTIVTPMEKLPSPHWDRIKATR